MHDRIENALECQYMPIYNYFKQSMLHHCFPCEMSLRTMKLFATRGMQGVPVQLFDEPLGHSKQE